MTDTDLQQAEPCCARMSVLSEARKSIPAQTRKLQYCSNAKQVKFVDLSLTKEAYISGAVQVRLLLLAALAQEHVLYIGPPGTAKSELGRRLSRLCKGTFFERLLTRFSVPEVGY